MRKVMAGALAAVALAWAGATGAAEAAKAEPKQKDSGTFRRDTPAGDARTQRDATAAQRTEEKKHPLFEGKRNFDVDGKVASVSGDSVTIQRNELPSAKLHVSKNTKIEVDGKKASVQQLKQGQDVKASFNLQGDKVEAVEIKAHKLDKDDRKELREQRQETQQKVDERARDAQKPQQKQR